MDIYFLTLKYIDWETHEFCVPDVKNKKSLTSFFRVILSQYVKAFGLPAAPIALLAPGDTAPLYLLRYKSLFYTRKLAEWIILPLNNN